MLLPLGLLLKFPRLPIITIILVVLNIYTYIFHANYRNDGLIIQSFQENDAYLNTRARFYTEYCYSQNYGTNICENVKLILSVGHKKNSNLDNINTKYLMDPSLLDAVALIDDTRDEINKDVYQDDFKVLDSYTDFLVFYEELQDLSATRAARYDLLTDKNINLKSIFLAMFRHANLAHILGNMFMLIVFGIYVEFRMKAAHYIGLYLLSGFVGLGLYTLINIEANIPLMGASANVFGIMGAFYIFFIRFKFKVLVFYLVSKTISVPVKYWFFIFFFLLEFINMFSKTNVAHGAHIYGLIIGVLIALYLKRTAPLAENLLYPLELDKIKEIKNCESLNIKLIRTRNLLEINPYNEDLRNYIFNEIFEEATHDKSILLEKSDFLESQLPLHLKNIYQRDGVSKLAQILNNMPDIISFQAILDEFRYKDLVNIIDHTIHQKDFKASVRTIGVIFTNYKNHRQLPNFERTLHSIFEHFSLSLDASIYVLKYSKNKRFDQIIKDHVDAGV